MRRFKTAAWVYRLARMAWARSDWGKRSFWSWLAGALRDVSVALDRDAFVLELQCAYRIQAEPDARVRAERERTFFKRYLDARTAGDDELCKELLSRGP